MKKMFLLAAMAVTFAASAQRPDVLIGNDYESISGFGGVLISISEFGGEVASYTGGGGAVLLDNTFYFVGYGLGLNDDRRLEINGVDYDVDFRHGGFLLGYNIKPERLVHLSVSTRLGWGSIDYDPFENSLDRFDDQVFVVHPQVEVEFNMTHWFKLNVGA
ncbi:MAG: hypothetical protein AAFN93_29205, partial [Bacteroidota bacterium]